MSGWKKLSTFAVSREVFLAFCLFEYFPRNLVPLYLNLEFGLRSTGAS
ncbi:MAG: hypothetical protein VX768_04890 [Planctomycetota bacterium]|nr:hypothetical protein [Planctomycetota bacterium]